MGGKSGKSGNAVFEVEVLGVDIETINGTIVTKQGLQALIRHGLDVKARQARGAVNSYVSEGWTEVGSVARLRLHDGVCHVDSAADRVVRRRDEAWEQKWENIKNGRRGRPRKRP